MKLRLKCFVQLDNRCIDFVSILYNYKARCSLHVHTKIAFGLCAISPNRFMADTSHQPTRLDNTVYLQHHYY